MDVVIVTLLRETLKNTIDSIKKTLPDPNIILITGKGAIGELRNKGLFQCKSSLMCFVDDDIIVNKNWYSKCMDALQTHPDVIAVCGRTPVCYTLGCMICRTEEFKKTGGFPYLDSQVTSKLGSKMLTLSDAVCEHQIKRGLEPIRHNIHFLCHGFQTESKAGWWFKPSDTAKVVFDYFRTGYPDFAVGFSLWFIKTVFVLPFIVEDMRSQKKLKKDANSHN